MQIAADILLFSFAVFLNFIGLASSEARTLEDLFPGFNGVMPPVEEFRYEDELHNFETLDDMYIISVHGETFLKRDHVIFGWMHLSEIANLGELFHFRHILIVFDTVKDEWVTVSHDLSRKLGITHRLPLLVARDQVAARHKLTSNNPGYKQAHLRACRYANDQVDIVEREQEYLLRNHQTTIEDVIIKIKEEYSQAYDREMTLSLHHHGEYNIEGLRERHP